MLAGAGVATPASSRPTPAAASGSAVGEVQVLADDKPTAGAGSVSSAVVVSLATPVNITFTYSTQGVGSSAPASLTVAVARVQLIVFDVAAGVKEVDLSDVHAATSGSVSVIGDYSYARYLVEGAYEMHALLLDPNGATLFSETFYLKVHTAYDLTVVVALFGILILYELYTVATLASASSVTKMVKAAEEARQSGPPGASP
jgi:hypothetical protein